MKGMGRLVEEIIDCNNSEMKLTYSAIETMAPINHHLAIIQLHQNEENTLFEWETEIDGCIWRQKSFPYQAKCLMWINEEYNLLSDIDKVKVNDLLKGTGCEKLIVS